MGNFKNEIKGFYDSKQLSSARLRRLQERPSVVEGWKYFAPVAVLSLFFIVSSLLSPSLEELLAQEVSYNHLKGIPSEVLTSDYAELNQALDRLDFNLLKSQRLGDQYALIGGRYCSVQGAIAAQLALKDKESGRSYTLYQFVSSTAEKSLSQRVASLSDRGVLVKIWFEDGVGFALAESLAP